MTDPTALPNFNSAPSAQPAGSAFGLGAGNGSETPLRDAVLEVLRTDGLPCEIDADGDVSYTIDEQTLFARCAEAELPILRVLGQWHIGEEVPGDELARLRAATEVSLRLNFAKVGIENGLIVVVCDNLVFPDSDIRGLLQLSTQLVLTGVQVWHERMLGGDPFGMVEGEQGQQAQQPGQQPGQLG